MKKIILLIFVLCFNTLSYADDFIDPMKDDMLAPVQTDAWKILAIGTALTGVSLIFKDITIRQATHEIADEKPLGKYSKYGDTIGQILPNIIYTSFYSADYWINDNKRSKDLGLMMFKSTLYSGLTTDILKKVFNETRPNGSGYSFPSGHTTSAFAFASVVAMNHNAYAGSAAIAMASFVGLSRVNDKKHYIHDVIAGAAIGASYGVGLYYNQQQKVLPVIAPLKDGIALGLSFDY